MDLEGFTDLEEALAYLGRHHYLYTFQCSSQGWRCKETGEVFLPEDLSIISCHRFNRSGGKHKVTVLYAVSTPKGEKGVILDNCSTYGNSQQGELLVRMKLQQLVPVLQYRR